MSMERYPGATLRPSTIAHPSRPRTLGLVIHWTAGSEPGDLAALDGPNVDCFAYVTKAGKVFQFLDPGSQQWHAFHTANTYCPGIEHEGRGEPWTSAQLAASAKLAAWICTRYGIPVRKVDPSGHDLDSFRGIFGHRDLSIGGERVDGNNHTDSVPDGTGWDTYLTAIRQVMHPAPPPPPPLPGGASLRLVIGGRGFCGWEDAAGPIAWIARNRVKDGSCAIAWQGSIWRGPAKVTGVCRHLYFKHLQPRGL